MEKIKIIFLDIDGVLNPSVNIWMRKKKGESTNSNNIILPGDKIYRLKRIVNSTNASIVMSSSWRLGFKSATFEPSKSYQNAYNQLARYGIYMIGWTPLHKDRNRGIEIQWWLNQFYETNHYIPNYVIIDDNIRDLLELHSGHIIKTTTILGLQDEHVNIAISILNISKEEK